MSRTIDTPIETDAAIRTWFGVGGRADRLARPRSRGELLACIQADPELRVLGDGANLLVDDGGVRELVVDLGQGEFAETAIDPASGLVRVGAGSRLPKLIHATVRAGLSGLEGLIGVPASMGGAVRMNAGGSFGEIADAVERVHGLDRAGRPVVLERADIAFGYRTSGLDGLIVTEIELRLTPSGPDEPRERLKRIMAGKAATQPLRAASCGCVFKNPTLIESIPGVGDAGDRVSAGLLIDRAGGKGMAAGACTVSHRHANFVETGRGATASDVLRLIDRVRALVLERFGIELQNELVVWRSRS